MKEILIALFMMLSVYSYAASDNQEIQIKDLQNEIENLKSQQQNSQKAISYCKRELDDVTNRLCVKSQQIDSLKDRFQKLSDEQVAIGQKLSTDIDSAKLSMSEAQQAITTSVNEKTVLGCIVAVGILVVIAVVSFFQKRRMASNDNTIDAIRKSQLQLQEAQKSIEEESVKLDNKLIEILENKVVDMPEATIDHSLVLKVADEITRIELNLSKMDSSIKGYKQLVKGIERIKDNFSAKGYEIADMLGKPYNDGMRINADFVIDESLELGTRIITSIIKPQVVYNGELIQKAIVTVNQNI